MMIMYPLTDCDQCEAEHLGDCPVHGPLIIVEDTKVTIRLQLSFEVQYELFPAHIPPRLPLVLSEYFQSTFIPGGGGGPGGDWQ
jgi:hypothetical protein